MDIKNQIYQIRGTPHRGIKWDASFDTPHCTVHPIIRKLLSKKSNNVHADSLELKRMF